MAAETAAVGAVIAFIVDSDLDWALEEFYSEIDQLRARTTDTLKVFNLNVTAFDAVFKENPDITRAALIGLPWKAADLPARLQKNVLLAEMPYAYIPRDVHDKQAMRERRRTQFRDFCQFHIVDKKTLALVTAEQDFSKQSALRAAPKKNAKPQSKDIRGFFKP